MRHPRRSGITFLVLLALLVPLLPPSRSVSAQSEPLPLPLLEPEPAPSDLPVPEQQYLEVPNTHPPALPSLTLHLLVQPEGWVSPGDVITATILVHNQAEFPADELSLSLPLPADATPADPADPALTAAGWQWQPGSLPSHVNYSHELGTFTV